jgi:protocatechuate 3,4-dioxygenase beta subunit
VLSGEGSPIAGATVCAFPITIANNPQVACTVSDALGGYAFARLARKDYRLSATSSQFGTGQNKEPLRLGECAAQSDVDLTLSDSGAILAGRVRDNLGGSVTNAEVTIVGVGGNGKFVTSVNSGTHGEFSVFVPMGATRLDVQAPKYATAHVQAVAPNNDVEVVLIPDAALAGRVLAESTGEGIAGVNVYAVPNGTIAKESAPSAVSDSGGNFEIAGLTPGAYRLSAIGPHWRGDSDESVDLGFGERIENLVVHLTPGTHVSAHVVVGSSRQPCKEGHVVLSNAGPEKTIADTRMALTVSPVTLTSMIETDGNVYFEGVPPGKFYAYVRCFANNQKEAPPSIDVDDRNIDDLEWVVEPAPSVVITVADEAGHLVADANVGLLDDLNAYRQALYQGNGQYTYVSLLPGRYRVVAQGGHLVGGDQGVPVTIPDGAEKVAVRVTLEGSGVIQVRVHHSSGSSYGGLQVNAIPEDGAGAASKGNDNIVAASEQGDGLYRIAPLRSGSYHVHVEDGHNRAMIHDVTLASGESRNLDLTIDYLGKISGDVANENGKPLAHVMVSAIHGSARPTWPPKTITDGLQSGSALTDDKGHFEIHNLEERMAYNVIADKTQGVSVIREGVATGEYLNIVIPSPRSLSGTVVDDNNSPVSQFSVQAVNAETGIGKSQAVSNPQGEWVLKGVMPGNVLISARDAVGRVGTSEFTVQPGIDANGLRLTLK